MWALVRFHSHGIPGTRAMARFQKVPEERIEEVKAGLNVRGLVAGSAIRRG